MQVITERGEINGTANGVVLIGCIGINRIARVIVVDNPPVWAHRVAYRTCIEDEFTRSSLKIFTVNKCSLGIGCLEEKYTGYKK
jgi:hypothetical protein